MPIRLKVARTARELDDVFRLRYDVFVTERGKFSAHPEDPRIVDRYDAMPEVANVVAYEGDLAIAAMRINRDNEMGLPAERFYDFQPTRAKLARESQEAGEGEPLLACGSMLAVRQEYRNRRNVILALFKEAVGVMRSWGTTHVIGAVRADTLSMYGRIGFEPIDEPFYVDSIGDDLIPILAPFDKVFEWSLHGIRSQVSNFWVDVLSPDFQRLLLAPGEVLFRQGDEANHAYAIEDGWISITRRDPEGNEMVLANLSRGALFGELAIFDGETRSATATALVNTELISIEREVLIETTRQNPERMDQLLEHFARRIRKTDDLAMVLYFAPEARRVQAVLHELWRSSEPDRKHEKARVAKVGPDQVAKMAQVEEEYVRTVLELKTTQGCLEYGRRSIRFFREPSVDTPNEVEKESPV